MYTDGAFGEYMQVSIQNDGPVTITIDSKEKNTKKVSVNTYIVQLFIALNKSFRQKDRE